VAPENVGSSGLYCEKLAFANSDARSLAPEKRGDARVPGTGKTAPEKRGDARCLAPEKRGDARCLAPEKRGDARCLAPEAAMGNLNLQNWLSSPSTHFELWN
jgi:hypothetical protein